MPVHRTQKRCACDRRPYQSSPNMTEFRISLARTDQIMAIVTLWQEVESWGERGVGRIWHDDEISEQIVRFYVGQGELFTLTENSAGGVIGTITLTDIDPSRCWEIYGDVKALYIQRVAVDRAYAGRGFGHALLKFSEQRARSRGRRFLRLDCDSERHKLCCIYEKFGFERVGSALIAGFDAVLYEKGLANNLLDNYTVV